MSKTQRAAAAASALVVAAAIIRRARASRRVDFAGRSVLITGGSRGLGLLVARQLGDEGARITIAARDAGELERARQDLSSRGVAVTAVVCDVSIAADAERLVRDVAERTGSVDVLINNAGIISVGPVDHMSRADFEQAMAVHFWGPFHTMLAAVPIMRHQGRGHIVNVSSIGGRIAVPHLVPYCASKFALAGLSDGLRAELRKDGIYVTTAFPGLMRTGSPFNAWFKGQHRDEFTWFAIADSLPIASMDGRRAAVQLVEACRHGDAEVVIGWPAKLAVMTHGLIPGTVARAMSLVHQFVLPPGAETPGTAPRSGWQSLSDWAPSALTRLTERAARDNNELPVR